MDSKNKQTVDVVEKRNGESSVTHREPMFPTLRSDSPFTFMRHMAEEMERLFEEWDLRRSVLTPMFGRQPISKRIEEFGKRAYLPDIEVVEKDGSFIVRADLPGMNKKDIHVEVSDRELVLRGERVQSEEEEHEGYYRSERAYGTFSRSIPLPEGVDGSSAKATFQDGVLEIKMKSDRKNDRKKLNIS
jgi:HSP20 family protein